MKSHQAKIKSNITAGIYFFPPNQPQAAVVPRARECALCRGGSAQSFATMSALHFCMGWVFMCPKNNRTSDQSLNHSKGSILLKEITKNVWLALVAFVLRSRWTLFDTSQYKLSDTHVSDHFRCASHKPNIPSGLVCVGCLFCQVPDYHLLLLVVQPNLVRSNVSVPRISYPPHPVSLCGIYK